MLKILLSPLALLYGIAVYVRNFLFDIGLLKSTSFTKPTICVGNLTVGGTGKTPHIEYLIRLLTNNYKIATLSRGYKRKTKGFKVADAGCTAAQIGDEPFQIFSKFSEIIVSVDENRVRGINNLNQLHPNLDVILLDDAFQHRYVKPGLSILLTDFNNLVSRDLFLPAGTLRDSITQIKRADIVIITKCPQNLELDKIRSIKSELRIKANQSLFFTKLNYGELKPVFDNTSGQINQSEDLAVFAVAGIANPKPFILHLESRFVLKNRIILPDHYHFSEKKIRAIFESFSQIHGVSKAIVTTEKDASRLKQFSNLPDELKKHFYYIPIEVEFLDDSNEEFNDKIYSYVAKS